MPIVQPPAGGKDKPPGPLPARQELSAATLDNLAAYLRSSVTLAQGRVYAGGLTKFEPKEMERLPIPSLESLREGDFSAAGPAATME